MQDIHGGAFDWRVDVVVERDQVLADVFRGIVLIGELEALLPLTMLTRRIDCSCLACASSSSYAFYRRAPWLRLLAGLMFVVDCWMGGY